MKETPIAAHGRMHALDGLRATMMLLGLVLHTAVSYTVIDLGAAWGYKDTATTLFADLVVMFIHVFRMPVFFVLAGFFAAMLCVRRGVAGFVNNRLQRIVLPFVVAVVRARLRRVRDRRLLHGGSSVGESPARCAAILRSMR